MEASREGSPGSCCASRRESKTSVGGVGDGRSRLSRRRQQNATNAPVAAPR